MAMPTGACWGGHFCVEPGIFVSNRAFLCRTMHFAVEPGFFVSNECYISLPHIESWKTDKTSYGYFALFTQSLTHYSEWCPAYTPMSYAVLLSNN